MLKIYTDDVRYDKIQEAVRLRYEEKANWETIAGALGIARSTLLEWRALPDWRDADAKWRRVLRDEARGDSSLMIKEATAQLYELMKTAKSPYVQYMAATKLIDINQVGNELEEQISDQKKELNEFLLLKAKAQIGAMPSVRAGGLLPLDIMEENERYRVRMLAEISEDGLHQEDGEIDPPA